MVKWIFFDLEGSTAYYPGAVEWGNPLYPVYPYLQCKCKTRITPSYPGFVFKRPGVSIFTVLV